MKPLIVGEAPGKNGDPLTPIEGRIGRRLAECCGLTFEEYLETFDRVNLLPEQPQDSGYGMKFSARKAHIAAGILERTFKPNQIVVILGKRAGAALDMRGFAYFQWNRAYYLFGEKFHPVDRVIVPHPSGVNRWYNNWDNNLQMIRFMREIVRRARG